MAIYAIGDVQGCYSQLQQLLEKINFDDARDQLWFAGDIINRGPESLASLRFIKSLGDSSISILGNHDLHLLAIASNNSTTGKKDTLDAILNAPDRDELLHWLRHRPLLHYNKKLDICMVHAGIYPAWSIKQATGYAEEVESVLRNDTYNDFFANMYGNKPDRWSPQLAGWDRLRFITNTFTRMRYCSSDLQLFLKDKGTPGSQAKHLYPWFELENKTRNTRIIFGHWSTLGKINIKRIYPLDTGCLWGGALTALKINKKLDQSFKVDCPQLQSFD